MKNTQGPPAGRQRETVPEAPSRVGPYRLERRLGQGGMGEVFLAHDDRLGRQVAVKRIRFDASLGPERRERFRREARAIAALNHPAVVQIHDLVEDEDGDSIVMEYVEGRTLRELLADGPLAPALVARLGRDVAEGLAEAHAAHLVHRDLKLSNVMVTPAGRAKILDFGLARSLRREGEEDLTLQGALLGTYHAMSPEQASGGEVDERSDLFSLGILLYEMLTGVSPFRGADALDTLRRLASHVPPSAATLRPDAPAGLTTLIDRLLAKDRDQRPGSAREVAVRLDETLGSGGTVGVPALTDLPTASRAPGVAPALTPGPAWQPDRTGSLSSPAGRRVPSLVRPLAAVLALLLVTGAAAYLFSSRRASPLRVVVLAPAVSPVGEEELEIAASGVLASLLDHLSAVEGVAPLDPTQAGPGTSSPAQAARSAAADEALVATLEGLGTLGARVSLRRVAGGSGRVLWSEVFDVPTAPRELRLLADAVAVHVRRAYADRPLREGVPALEVGDADYAAFLRLKRRIDSGDRGARQLLEDLDGILRRSPRFLPAHLVAADLGHNLYRSTQDQAYLERARAAVAAARELAPDDPRVLTARFKVDLASDRGGEAESVLARYAELLPGDPEVEVLASLLAEHKGETDRAVAHLEAAVRKIPSWQNLYRLADLQYRSGRIPEARRHLQELLARTPDNIWGLQKLGEMELMMGDPARAERHYLDLIRLEPQRAFYTNLGLSRFLLGRYDGAVAAYRRALELDPGHTTVLLNLADAELALGRRGEALKLYGEVLARLRGAGDSAGLDDDMMAAQCLAHLGRPREAVEVAQRILQSSPGDPNAVYLASLVYAVAGDRASALVNAKLALDKGIQARWFTIPAFAPLRDDPELQALLRASGRPEPAS